MNQPQELGFFNRCNFFSFLIINKTGLLSKEHKGFIENLFSFLGQRLFFNLFNLFPLLHKEKDKFYWVRERKKGGISGEILNFNCFNNFFF